MSTFNRGERVRVIEVERDSKKIYIVKDVKKIRGGGVLYLLKSLEKKSVLRLHYESQESPLERVP